jgi:hypothetical protein
LASTTWVTPKSIGCVKPSSPQALKHGAAEIAVLVQDELGIVNKIM